MLKISFNIQFADSLKLVLQTQETIEYTTKHGLDFVTNTKKERPFFRRAFLTCIFLNISSFERVLGGSMRRSDTTLRCTFRSSFHPLKVE